MVQYVAMIKTMKGEVMRITKAVAQYYSSFVEQAVCGVLGDTSNISSQHVPELLEDARKIRESLPFPVYEYIGNYTSKENGDFRDELGNVYELKYGTGVGTWYNTSMSYGETLGFDSFIDYQGDYRKIIEDNGYDVLAGISPVSVSVSKQIRKVAPLYEAIKQVEKPARDRYVSDLYHFLVRTSQSARFASDLISKHNSGKELADYLVLFNYVDKTTQVLDIKNIASTSGNELGVRSATTLSTGRFDFTFAWQNGTGLNNPTIRVFLR